MIVSEKIKRINMRIKKSKTQYNLDRQTAKISAVSLGNICKYEFLINEDILVEEELLEKATTTKRFEYSPLGCELRKQTISAKDQYQALDKAYGFSKTVKKSKNSDLVFDILNLANSVLLMKSLMSFLLTQNINSLKTFSTK